MTEATTILTRAGRARTGAFRGHDRRSHPSHILYSGDRLPARGRLQWTMNTSWLSNAAQRFG